MVIEGINANNGTQVQSSVQTSVQTVENTDVSTAKTGEYATAPKAVNVELSNAASTKENATVSEQLSNEQLKRAIEQFNKSFGNSEAVYGVHEATNRVTIKIIDKDTKEVIKELPPEKTLDMIAKVWELAGILVDEKR